MYHYAIDKEGNVMANYGMNHDEGNPQNRMAKDFEAEGKAMLARPTSTHLLTDIASERARIVSEINDLLDLLTDDLSPVLMGAIASSSDTSDKREDRCEFEMQENRHIDSLYQIRRRISDLRERYALNK